MLELVPPDEERAWRKRFAVAPDLGVYASILRTTWDERRWRRFRFNPLTNHLEWDRFQAKLEAELKRLADRPSAPGALVARVHAHEDLVREYVGVHVCSLLFANLSWQLLDGALASWLPERRVDLMEGLAVCPSGNLTVETNAALHALARAATDEDLDALARGEVRPPFADRLGSFLERFGHRSEASWELMSARWRRHPERLVPLLRAQRRIDAEPPEDRARRQEERHGQALAELRSALSGPRLTTAELLVHYTRRYLLLRENQRFWFDRLLSSMQDTLLALGGWAVAGDVLDEAEDVAFLTWPELQGLVAGTLPPEGVRATVERRRAERDADAREEPPTFLHGDAVPEPLPDTPRLQGLGISPGRARGRVRVVRTVDEGSKLEPGDVLVTRAVDPGWTPLFLTASAVVLELGSVLSHGAVVAREYRVPAVVNIEGATKRLRDGQEVTVDGTRGVVWVHGADRARRA
jgi:pyruvate,water dikinase